MLVRMEVGRDLFYPGELVALDDTSARQYISAGVAEPALCPEYGAQLEARGYGAICPECNNQRGGLKDAGTHNKGKRLILPRRDR